MNKVDIKQLATSLEVESVSDSLTITPRQLRQELPLTPKAVITIANSREEAKDIMSGKLNKVLLLIGPCSMDTINGGKSLLEVAQRYLDAVAPYREYILPLVRCYPEKPRSNGRGWTGSLDNPNLLDGLADRNMGLRIARKQMIAVNELGIGIASEFLHPHTPLYLGGTVTYGAIGARAIEGQFGHQMASNLNFAMGFKNMTNGNIEIAIEKMISAAQPLDYWTINEDGQQVNVRTKGNKHTQLILRGGQTPNYDEASITNALELLKSKNLPQRLGVDASHMNSGKIAQNQHKSLASLVEYIASGKEGVTTIMAEVNLVGGKQNHPQTETDVTKLIPGLSLTDECMPIDEFIPWIKEIANAVKHAN